MKGFFLGCATIGVAFSASALAGVTEGYDAWNAKKFDKAVAEWRGPAERGDARAQFNLGQAYKLGRGVPADRAMAMDWYRKSAEKGYVQAQAMLGLHLFQEGKHQDALVWLKKAADQNEGRSQYVVATAYFNGDSLAKDWARAYALMLRAKANGIGAATTSLAQMEQLIPDQQRKAGMAIAREMERKAALDDQEDEGSGPVVPAAGDTGSTRIASASAPPPPAPAAPIKPAPVKPAPVKPAPATIAPARVASAAPTAAPGAAAATVAATPGGGWKIQLGAFSSSDGARAGWARLAGKSAALKALTPSYVQAGAITRLQAGPLGSRSAANQACAAVKAASGDCFAVAP